MSSVAFLQDLAVLMSAAGLAALVCTRFGWSKVLGYLFVGIVMSEHTWGGSFLTSPASAQLAGQIGIVYLMFGMGLSFSPREMKKIRAVAFPAALVDTIVMIWIGYTIGLRVFGWSAVQSVFLGVAICDSATTLLAKVIGELGWEKRPFTKYVLGTSICEDIICVGAIAVATGFASSGNMSALALVKSLGGLGVFFLSVLAFGFVLIPRLLDSSSRRHDDETLLLTLLGCGFLITFIADRMGCSLALGAFLVGLIGGTCDVRDKLVRLIDPLKSVYSAVFFISIGLLVDPSALWTHLPQILLISLVIVVGKFLNIALVSIAAGVEVKTAVQTGLSLAQIGEFAFMVAILHAALTGSSGGAFFSVAIGASLLTTVLNPLLIRVSDKAGDLAERMIPDKLAVWLEDYRNWMEKLRSSRDSRSLVLLRKAVMRLGILAALIIATAVIFSTLSRFDYSRFSTWFERHDTVIFFIWENVNILMLFPLVVAGTRDLGRAIARLLIGSARGRWVRPMYRIFSVFVMAAVLLVFFIGWLMIAIASAPRDTLTLNILISVFFLMAVGGWQFFKKTGQRAAMRFRNALTAEERREGLEKTMTVTVPEGTLHNFTLDASSPAIGETVVTLNIRAKTGASVVAVVREGVSNRNIGPDWEFAVGDRLVALGDHRQIVALKDLLGVVS